MRTPYSSRRESAASSSSLGTSSLPKKAAEPFATTAASSSRVAHYPEETLTRGLSILCDVVKDCTGAPALGATAPFTAQETAPFTAQETAPFTAQGERNHRSQLSVPEELEFEACSMGL